jgi:ankyrin repeat protein
MNRNINKELHNAAWENNVPEVSRLLSVGADVNAKNEFGLTPLHNACYNAPSQVVNVQVVKELLDHGANTEAKAINGWTPLHFASMHGHLPIVKVLLCGGANILAGDGILPINLAAIQGHSAVAKYLLREFYATTARLPLYKLLEDVTSKNATPLYEALHENVVGTDDVVEILEYLVGRNPALLSSRDQDGSLPLHVACRRGAPFAIVQSLVNHYKASVKSVTPQGDLPLFLACEMRKTSLDTIFLLVKLYPDLVYR